MGRRRDAQCRQRSSGGSSGPGASALAELVRRNEGRGGLKELEDKNERLKEIVADLTWDNRVLKQGAEVDWWALWESATVEGLQEEFLSFRAKACYAMEHPRSSWRYESLLRGNEMASLKGMRDSVRNVDVYEHFVAYRDRLSSVKFLEDFLRPHCVFRRLRMRGSWLRIVQIPTEFAEFLVFMEARNISSYLEIGVSTGGSWFAVDSYLRAVNSSFAGSVGYDRTAKLRDYDVYRAKFPTCEFRHCHSKNMVLEQDFDMAFIDSHHTEEWVRHDFEKVRAHARFVAFHDIVLKGCTVNRFWLQVRDRYPSWEFIDTTLPETCGIGVLALAAEAVAGEL